MRSRQVEILSPSQLRRDGEGRWHVGGALGTYLVYLRQCIVHARSTRKPSRRRYLLLGGSYSACFESRGEQPVTFRDGKRAHGGCQWSRQSLSGDDDTHISRRRHRSCNDSQILECGMLLGQAGGCCLFVLAGNCRIEAANSYLIHETF